MKVDYIYYEYQTNGSGISVLTAKIEHWTDSRGRKRETRYEACWKRVPINPSASDTTNQ